MLLEKLAKLIPLQESSRVGNIVLALRILLAERGSHLLPKGEVDIELGYLL